jgi:hypothetical protein
MANDAEDAWAAAQEIDLETEDTTGKERTYRVKRGVVVSEVSYLQVTSDNKELCESKPNQNFTASLTGDAVTLWAYRQVDLPDARLYVDGRPRAGQLVFGLYDRDAGNDEFGERPLTRNWQISPIDLRTGDIFSFGSTAACTALSTRTSTVGSPCSVSPMPMPRSQEGSFSISFRRPAARSAARCPSAREKRCGSPLVITTRQPSWSSMSAWFA